MVEPDPPDEVRPPGAAALPEDVERLSRELAAALARVPGVVAVVLGGSHARGCARPDSDVDLGVFYEEARPFDLAALRALAARVHEGGEPEVTEPYAWGPWVNGGAWLRVGGRRVDWLYRSFERVDRVFADAEAGRSEIHFAQQPPFGFWSGTLLGELAICQPLVDPEGRVAARKRRAGVYPEALRRQVVSARLWGVEFGLAAFARKAAARGEVAFTAGCLARAGYELTLAVFALERVWLVNDKTALAETRRFGAAPRHFASRLDAVLAAPGRSAAELLASVDAVAALWRDVVEAAGPLYSPRLTQGTVLLP